MSFNSGMKGADVVSLLKNGLPIVDSVDKLDANATFGSIACVAKQGAVSEMSFKDLYQPDASIVDFDTGNLDISNCAQVESIKIIPPAAPIPITIDMPSEYPPMLSAYFVSEDMNLMSGEGVMAIINPIIEDVEGVGTAIVGCIAATMTYDGSTSEYTLFYVGDSGEFVVNQEDINAFNDCVRGFYYVGPWDAIMMGDAPVHEAYPEIYDSFATVVAGQSSRANIYLKKDSWEELYKEELNKINKINQKSDVVSNAELEDVGGDINLEPNTYNRYTFSYDNGQHLSVILNNPSNPAIYNEYILELRCATTPNVVYFHYGIGVKWANDNEPVFEAGFTYIISIVNGFGVYSSFLN